MEKTRGYFGIGLYEPKHKENIGSVLRSANCFGARFVALSGTQAIKAKTDTAKAGRHMPVFQGDILRYVPAFCTPIAVEITEDARELSKFVHPERAYYIFGPENGSLPEHILSYCTHTIQIPTKYCLNLGTCVAIICYDRQSKQLTFTREKSFEK